MSPTGAPERERLRAAALQQAGELSPQRLAAGLGVAVTQVPEAGALPDLVVEAITCALPQDAGIADTWGESLTGLALAYRQVLLAHPDAVPVVAGQPVRTAAGLAVVERLLGHLCAGGLTPPEALACLNAVVVWTLGYVGVEIGMVEREPSGAAAGLPLLQDALARTMWGLPHGEFRFGLEALVRGLAAVLSDD